MIDRTPTHARDRATRSRLSASGDRGEPAPDSPHVCGMLALVAAELRRHAPFPLLGTATGAAVMALSLWLLK